MWFTSEELSKLRHQPAPEAVMDMADKYTARNFKPLSMTPINTKGVGPSDNTYDDFIERHAME